MEEADLNRGHLTATPHQEGRLVEEEHPQGAHQERVAGQAAVAADLQMVLTLQTPGRLMQLQLAKQMLWRVIRVSSLIPQIFYLAREKGRLTMAAPEEPPRNWIEFMGAIFPLPQQYYNGK